MTLYVLFLGDRNLQNCIQEIWAENKELKLVLQNLEKVTLGMKIDLDLIREENAMIKSLCKLGHGRHILIASYTKILKMDVNVMYKFQSSTEI